MSLEKIIRILENFGFSKQDAEVYICLAKKGPKKKKDLAQALKFGMRQLNRSLIHLKSRGVITSSVDKSVLFSAINFETVLDLLVEENIELACSIKETKEEILVGWRSTVKLEDT